MARPRPRRTPRVAPLRASAIGRALVALLAVASLFVALQRSGSRFFYCSGMEALLEAPCCAHDAPADGEDDAESALQADDSGCCEVHRVAPLPAGAMAIASSPPAAPFVATIPFQTAHGDPLIAPLNASIEATALLPRAGPCTALERCTRLQSFLL